MPQRWMKYLALMVVFTGFGLAARLLPHPPNFAPIAAIALFAGFFVGPGLLTVAIPIASMLCSDLIIGTYDYRVMMVVYAGLCLPVAMASLVRRRLSALSVVGCTLACSTAFFALTNLAVWYFGSLYSHDAAGLTECYVAALPFFRFTLAGDLGWGAVLFGTYHLAHIPIAFRLRQLAWQRASAG